MTSSNLRVLVAPLLALAALLLLTWPVWRWLWGEWMGNQYYSHGILIPFVSLFLIIMRIRNDDTFAWIPGNGLLLGMLMLIAGVALYIYFVQQRAYYLANVTMIDEQVGPSGQACRPYFLVQEPPTISTILVPRTMWLGPIMGHSPSTSE